ncbi:MAG TPA: alpha/beta hydrolase, partial [Bacillota bacterium]|nr:alpha/beta hydrolase [Bacillota bacterium]
MPYIHGNGINLFYEDIGVGEPLIFLHGSFSRGIISFSAQMMDFQSDYRCIFPDLRGHGRTVTDDLNWDLPDLADDIIWLMDQLHIQTASVIGFSLGGYLAYYCASRYPERFKVMISIGSNANYNDDTRNSAI